MVTGPRPPWHFVLLSSVVVLGLLSAAGGQDSLNEVHVLPPTEPSHNSLPRPVLRANVDLVLVPVTVLDHAERMVTGLHARNFAIIDNKLPQTISFFSAEDSPLSLTVILDASASMAARMAEARRAVRELFNFAHPLDEFRLITFGDQVRSAGYVSDAPDDLPNRLASVEAGGFTALWDSMYFGITELKKGRYERKAIVVISDGGDNRSRHPEGEIKSLLKEADVQVYALGMFSRSPRTPEEKMGPLQLDEVTTLTGGRLFAVHDAAELGRAVSEIGLELRNQYVLGYYPSHRERDGKWRKLKVQLVATPGQARLRVYARKGYYGPAE